MKIVIAILNTVFAIGVGFMLFIQVVFLSIEDALSDGTHEFITLEMFVWLVFIVILIVSAVSGWITVFRPTASRWSNIGILFPLPIFLIYAYAYLL